MTILLSCGFILLVCSATIHVESDSPISVMLSAFHVPAVLGGTLLVLVSALIFRGLDSSDIKGLDGIRSGMERDWKGVVGEKLIATYEKQISEFRPRFIGRIRP